MKTLTYSIALSGALLSLGSHSLAAADSPDPWRFGVTLPVWAAGIDGDVTLRGNTADVDIGFDDLKDHLDASFSLGLEARKEKFGFFTGIGYLKFSADGNFSGGGEAESELKFIVADLGGFYRLLKTGNERPFVLEATAGVRYWSTDTELKITGPGGGVLLDSDKKRDLLDPFIGLRATQYLTRKFHLDFQGDVGGFGISDDTSDFSWSAAAMVSYDAAKWCTLSAGYKALALDVERGSGGSKDGLDIVMHGLLLAAKFKF